MFRLLRISLVLLLAASLSTTAVLAASGQEIQPRWSVISTSTPVDLVSQLWSFLTRIWSKNGSEMDPSGVRTKNGSDMDPNGNKLQTPNAAPMNQGNGHQVGPNRQLGPRTR
jgi:hypothetical protein